MSAKTCLNVLICVAIFCFPLTLISVLNAAVPDCAHTTPKDVHCPLHREEKTCDGAKTEKSCDKHEYVDSHYKAFAYTTTEEETEAVEAPKTIVCWVHWDCAFHKEKKECQRDFDTEDATKSPVYGTKICPKKEKK